MSLAHLSRRLNCTARRAVLEQGGLLWYMGDKCTLPDGELMDAPDRDTPQPHNRQGELLRLWRWRSAVTLFWFLFAAGLIPVYFLFSSLAAVGVWCLVFALPLMLSVVVLKFAECPRCNRRLSRGNPLQGLLAKSCPHCGLSLNPGADADRDA